MKLIVINKITSVAIVCVIVFLVGMICFLIMLGAYWMNDDCECDEIIGQWNESYKQLKLNELQLKELETCYERQLYMIEGLEHKAWNLAFLLMECSENWQACLGFCYEND